MVKRRKLVGLFFVIILALGLPTAVLADSHQYELVSWKLSIVGDGTGITFGFYTSNGQPLNVGVPIPRFLVSGHENDSSWTGFDSVAPLLAYIKAGGMANISSSIKAENYDPTIFKSLTAQGINLSQLGGPDVPPGSAPPSNLVGKSVLPQAMQKNVVGIGLPVPDLSGISSSSAQQTQSDTSPAPVPQPTQSPSSSSSTAQSTPPPQAKTGTQLNPVPDKPTETASESKPDPDRLNPPPKSLPDTTTTKLPEPKQTNKTKTTWPLWVGAGTVIVILVGIAVYLFIRKRKNQFFDV